MSRRTLCAFFARGSCKYGNRCWFLHSLASETGSTGSDSSVMEGLSSESFSVSAGSSRAMTPAAVHLPQAFRSSSAGVSVQATPAIENRPASAAPTTKGRPPQAPRINFNSVMAGTRETGAPLRPLRAAALPHTGTNFPDPLPMRALNYTRALSIPERHLLIGMMKVRVAYLVYDRKIFRAADELCRFLLSWDLYPPKRVELLCVCAAIEPSVVFLEAVLCLA